MGQDGEQMPPPGGFAFICESKIKTVAPSRENFRKFERPGVSGSLTTGDFTAAVLQGYFKKHRIFVISGYPLCKSRCLHDVPDFVTNRIVKRRFFTQKDVKAARFTYFAAFYVCGLGEARVDTKNRITSGELR